MAALLPFTALLNPDVKYFYPVEMNVFDASKTSLNFLVNFSLQAIGFFNWTFIFYNIFLIFLVMVMNIRNELKIIESLCRMVGDAEENSTNEYQGTLSRKVLSVIFEDLKSETTSVKPETRCDEISRTLRTILKYHSNIIS